MLNVGVCLKLQTLKKLYKLDEGSVEFPGVVDSGIFGFGKHFSFRYIRRVEIRVLSDMDTLFEGNCKLS